ncbi:hypothetical protein SHM_15880 [Spiroplasma ixodetis]|uniref:Spiroplasmavirus-related protein n=1 Tax=Spiroplasma ixodetis TaxID=2141 RepID=A0ABM8BVP0_9MOLU|nr:hypothetical protein SHM_15880 [Spiroplasma ixodetis]
MSKNKKKNENISIVVFISANIKKTWKIFRSFYIILLNNLGSTVEYIKKIIRMFS